MKKIHNLLILAALVAVLYTMSVNTSAIDEGPYQGAEFCGMCHAEKLSDWKGTPHANNTGIIPNTDIYWVHTPNNTMSKQVFIDQCASCHVVGWNETTKTWAASDDPTKFLNIQCENCHGPFKPHSSDNPVMVLDYDTKVCATCHVQPKDHALSSHPNSWTDLKNSGQAADSCLHCMTTQGFIGKTVTTSTPDLTSLSCASCHDVHEGVNTVMLRANSALELCSKCHVEKDQPQSELFPGGAHAIAKIECVDCHGQGIRLFEDELSPWFNHTFSVYNTYYPYTQSDPMVCSKCHDLDWASNQLGRIQSLTINIIANTDDEIARANTTIMQAKTVPGVSQTDISKATELMGKAADIVWYIEHDKSYGIHNPETVYSMLNEATTYASQAESTALNAHVGVLGKLITDLQTTKTQLEAAKADLESQVNTLKGKTANLEAKVQDLNNTNTMNLIFGGVGGLVIGALIIYFLKRQS